jgi:O-antigen ligase
VTRETRIFSLDRVIAGFCFLLPAVLVLSSQSVVVLLVVAALLGLVAAWREGRLPGGLLAGSFDRPLLGLALLVLAWAAVTLFWTPVPERALPTLGRLAALTLAGLLLVDLGRRLEPEARERAGRWLLLGFALGIALFLFERLNDNWLHYLVAEPKKGRSVLSFLNRGATGLALLIWPITALLYRKGLSHWALILPPAFFGLLFFYESQAAELGLLIGFPLLLLALASRRLANLALLGTLIGGLLAAPVLVSLAFRPDAFEAGIVEYSAQHRLYIWKYAAERIAERPLLGWGFDSSADIPAKGEISFFDGKKPIPLHPHNGALQIWLELGGIGTILSAAFLLLLARRSAGLGARGSGIDGPAAQALLLSGFAIACVSYGLWQNQWIAGLFASGLVAVATRGPARRGAPGNEA